MPSVTDVPTRWTGSVSFGIVDQPGRLAAQIVVDLVSRLPQLPGRHALRPTSTLAPENMHDRADPIEGQLSVYRLTVPNAPVQPLDLSVAHDMSGLGSTRSVR